MSRSHPPSLLTILGATWTREVRLPPGIVLGLAVSGGPDSMALLHACSLLRDRWDWQLRALTVDHGLRPEAKDEVELVAETARQLDVEVEVLRVQLSSGANLQARAREARYAELWQALERSAGQDAFLATAHHRADRAETVLLRLLRGTSLAGLGVLPPRDGRLLRPLVRADRRAIDEHLCRHSVPYVNDPSNEDPSFLRVRVRHELLPLLRQLGGDVDETLTAWADEARRLPEPLGLNREQRQQLRQALDRPDQALDLPFGGGLRLVRKHRKKPPPAE